MPRPKKQNCNYNEAHQLAVECFEQRITPRLDELAYEELGLTGNIVDDSINEAWSCMLRKKRPCKLHFENDSTKGFESVIHDLVEEYTRLRQDEIMSSPMRNEFYINGLDLLVAILGKPLPTFEMVATRFGEADAHRYRAGLDALKDSHIDDLRHLNITYRTGRYAGLIKNSIIDTVMHAVAVVSTSDPLQIAQFYINRKERQRIANRESMRRRRDGSSALVTIRPRKKDKKKKKKGKNTKKKRAASSKRVKKSKKASSTIRGGSRKGRSRGAPVPV